MGIAGGVGMGDDQRCCGDQPADGYRWLRSRHPDHLLADGVGSRRNRRDRLVSAPTAAGCDQRLREISGRRRNFCQDYALHGKRQGCLQTQFAAGSTEFRVFPTCRGRPTLPLALARRPRLPRSRQAQHERLGRPASRADRLLTRSQISPRPAPRTAPYRRTDRRLVHRDRGRRGGVGGGAQGARPLPPSAVESRRHRRIDEGLA